MVCVLKLVQMMHVILMRYVQIIRIQELCMVIVQQHNVRMVMHVIVMVEQVLLGTVDVTEVIAVPISMLLMGVIV